MCPWNINVKMSGERELLENPSSWSKVDTIRSEADFRLGGPRTRRRPRWQRRNSSSSTRLMKVNGSGWLSQWEHPLCIRRFAVDGSYNATVRRSGWGAGRSKMSHVWSINGVTTTRSNHYQLIASTTNTQRRSWPWNARTVTLIRRTDETNHFRFFRFLFLFLFFRIPVTMNNIDHAAFRANVQ